MSLWHNELVKVGWCHHDIITSDGRMVSSWHEINGGMMSLWHELSEGGMMSLWQWTSGGGMMSSWHEINGGMMSLWRSKWRDDVVMTMKEQWCLNERDNETIELWSDLAIITVYCHLPPGFLQRATRDEGDIVYEQLLWSGAGCTDCIPVQCNTGEEPRTVQVSPNRWMIVVRRMSWESKVFRRCMNNQWTACLL